MSLSIRSRVRLPEKLFKAPELRNWRNDARDTSLQALEYVIEEDRVKLEIMNEIGHRSDDFHCFKPTTMAILAVLKGHEYLSELDKARFTYGCTFGQCIEGLMSPPMRSFLTRKSREFQDELGVISSTTKTGAEFLERAEKYVKYVTQSTREAMRLDKTLYEGFVEWLQTFRVCLRGEVVPREPRVLERKSEDTLRYRVPERQSSFRKPAIGTMVFELIINADAIAWFLALESKTRKSRDGSNCYQSAEMISTTAS